MASSSSNPAGFDVGPWWNDPKWLVRIIRNIASRQSHVVTCNHNFHKLSPLPSHHPSLEVIFRRHPRHHRTEMRGFPWCSYIPRNLLCPPKSVQSIKYVLTYCLGRTSKSGVPSETMSCMNPSAQARINPIYPAPPWAIHKHTSFQKMGKGFCWDSPRHYLDSKNLASRRTVLSAERNG